MIAEYAESGEIFNLYSDPISPELVQALQADGRRFIERPAGESIDEQTQYVKNGALAPRPVLDGVPTTLGLLASGAWKQIATDIPAGALAVIDDQTTVPIDDGVLRLRSTEPGVFSVILRPPFPTQPAACQVTVA